MRRSDLVFRAAVADAGQAAAAARRGARRGARRATGKPRLKMRCVAAGRGKVETKRMSGSIWIWRYDERAPPLAGVWCGVSGNMVGMAAAGTKALPDTSAKVQLLGMCLAVLRGAWLPVLQAAG